MYIKCLSQKHPQTLTVKKKNTSPFSSMALHIRTWSKHSGYDQVLKPFKSNFKWQIPPSLYLFKRNWAKNGTTVCKTQVHLITQQLVEPASVTHRNCFFPTWLWRHFGPFFLQCSSSSLRFTFISVRSSPQHLSQVEFFDIAGPVATKQTQTISSPNMVHYG